jgi:hypothetical protein
MNAREKRYVSYIGLLLALLLPLLLATQGCTIYEVKRCEPGGDACTEVKVISSRDFEQPSIHYARGVDSAEFNFGAASATRAASPLEAIGAAAVQQALGVYLPAPQPQPQPQPEDRP